ncbi:hypothetical protein AB0J21_19735 [Streptomyces sp. NPDC049954]|uniref:hypothetical protein n=1 Tax=Streptomyces sp. NPDC049954 TaxID=3155779 RepID=UPI00344AFB17
MTTHTTDQDQPNQVVVELEGDSARDADAVLTALGGAFGSDRAPGDVPEDTEGRPTVWSATFDVSDERGKAAPVPLTGPVTLTAQGGYHAVGRLREALADVFAVHVTGTASGDQEQELQLRLEGK